jgi:gamma-glutamylcyclotransferase
MHYFAYGVNLNPKIMSRYCPGAIRISPGYIPDLKLRFDGQSKMRPGATANIQEAPGKIVWGALFEIRAKELLELDEWEGYPNLYDRKQVTVLTADGLRYEDVWVYHREGQVEGRPGPEYLGDVLEGARMCSLPYSYIKALKAVETL